MIHPDVARRATRQLGVVPKKLQRPRPLADWTGKASGTITETIQLSLEIDGRRFSRQEFLVAPCAYSIFIGQDWLAEQDVWLHPRTRGFSWPDDKPPIAHFSPPIIVSEPLSNLAAAKEHQKDADARDRAIEKTYQILQRPPNAVRGISRAKKVAFTDPLVSGYIPSLEDMVDRAAVASIRAHTSSKSDNRSMPAEPIPLVELDQDRAVNLRAITGPRSKLNNRGRYLPFPSEEKPEHVDLVRSKLPKELRHIEGFFSKARANLLPPSREGFDVVLEVDKPIEGSPPSYRTPYKFIPLEKETIDDLLASNFIESCMEPNAAPVLFADKPHSTEKRFCIDYRWINKFLKDRIVRAPDLPGTLFNCREATRFTKIDIIRAFNRLLLAPESRGLTAFRTRQGTFRWKVLPFGLKVGPAWWQEFINSQLQDLLDRCASAYADDVLLYGKGEAPSHFEEVDEVIQRLYDVQIQGDIKKSKFNVSIVDYLGVVMEAGVGVRIDPKKIEAITSWRFEDIKSRSAIKSFLGLCNYVRLFCHHASGVAEPLNRLLKKDVNFEMGHEQREAFDKLKELATTAPVLAFFHPDRPTKLETDASRNATGGVILQQQPEDQSWKPIGYFSKSMTPAERAYPIQDRELLAVIQTLEHFTPELLGMKFFVVTDHQALLYYSNKKLLSTRQVRWADFLANFDITFQYRRGSENIAADALSRKTVELPTVKAREGEDRTMPMIPIEKIETPTPSKVIAANRDTDTLRGADLVDLVRTANAEQSSGLYGNRLTVPEVAEHEGREVHLRTALIREAHDPPIFAHQGISKTVNLLKREYYWPNMIKDVERFISNCRECGRNKTRHDKTPGLLHPLPMPNKVWEHVVVDGKDMPKDRRGYDYVWVFICKFSRLIATLPGHKTDCAPDIAARYYKYLYRFLGVPSVWISDNAGPFVSTFLKTINELTGTKHRHGSSRHPQTQGAVEITNAELDQKLRFYIDTYQTNWSDHLPALDFSHNVSHHSSINMAPLKVLLGSEPRNPLSVTMPATPKGNNPAESTVIEQASDLVRQTKAVQDEAHRAALRAQESQRLQANKKRRPVDFEVGDQVFVSRRLFNSAAPTTRLASQWSGPFTIIAERGHSFEVEMPSSYKGSNLFHADRLRKAPTNPMPQQAVEPPPAEEIDGEPEWEIDQVLASRLFGKYKKLQYQVSWIGYDPDETWYCAEDLRNAPMTLRQFHDQYPAAAGPPKRLQIWIEHAANNTHADEHPDDNVAIDNKKSSKSRTCSRTKIASAYSVRSGLGGGSVTTRP